MHAAGAIQPAQSSHLGTAWPPQTLHVDAGGHQWAEPLQGHYSLQDDHHNCKPLYLQARHTGMQRRFYLRFATDSRWGFCFERSLHCETPVHVACTQKNLESVLDQPRWRVFNDSTREWEKAPAMNCKILTSDVCAGADSSSGDLPVPGTSTLGEVNRRESMRSNQQTADSSERECEQAPAMNLNLKILTTDVHAGAVASSGDRTSRQHRRESMRRSQQQPSTSAGGRGHPSALPCAQGDDRRPAGAELKTPGLGSQRDGAQTHDVQKLLQMLEEAQAVIRQQAAEMTSMRNGDQHHSASSPCEDHHTAFQDDGDTDDAANAWRTGLMGTDEELFLNLNFAGDMSARTAAPIPADSALCDVPEEQWYTFASVLRDGATELMQTGCSDVVAALSMKILDIVCKAHCNIKIDKESCHIARTVGKQQAHVLFNSLDANNLIPSLASTGLEIALRELEQNALYHNRDGEPVFAKKMRTYFENVGNVNGGYVTRAGACLLYPEGGMPSTNNAVEATNRTEHGNLHTRRPLASHLPRLMASQHIVSMMQKQFSNDVRSDTYHQDTWMFAHCLLHFAPYLGWGQYEYSILDAAVECVLPIEVIDESRRHCEPGLDGLERQIDFDVDLKREDVMALIVPTFLTVSWAIQESNAYEQGGKLVNALKTAAELKAYLVKENSDGTLSWLQQLVNLFQDGNEMLTDVTWEYWEQLHTSFAVLLPLLGEERIKAYLQRLERGVRARGKFEASEFGAKVHWDKVPWESGLKYCLCGDHRLRGMCVHVIAWLWIHGIIEPPDLWAPTRMHEKSDNRGRGRDHLYEPGSARKREMSTSAQHSVAKAQRHARAGTGGHMPQAVLFSRKDAVRARGLRQQAVAWAGLVGQIAGIPDLGFRHTPD